MEAAKNLYSAELAVLARNISCNFVDAQTSTKDYVRKLSEAGYHSESNPLTNHFVLSTCLRYEVYDCSKQQEHRAPLIYSNGTTCIRRLLSILVGLQSEIKGEREILSQVSSSIKDSYDKGYLNSTTFRGLQELIFISEQIRQSCGINSDENYSTIACDLFIDYLSDCKDAVIAIVGGGGIWLTNFFVQF